MFCNIFFWIFFYCFRQGLHKPFKRLTSTKNVWVCASEKNTNCEKYRVNQKSKIFLKLKCPTVDRRVSM